MARRLRSYGDLIDRVETGFVQIVSVKSPNLLPAYTYRLPFLQPRLLHFEDQEAIYRIQTQRFEHFVRFQPEET